MIDGAESGDRPLDDPDLDPDGGRRGVAQNATVDGPSVTETLSELFWSVARRLRRSSRAALAPWDIAPSHSRALNVLMQHQALRLSELSDQLHIAPRSTTDVVDGLQERGLIERTPDPHDRRAMLVSLTDDGHRVGTAIRAARDKDAERFFGALSDADRAELARILRTLRG